MRLYQRPLFLFTVAYITGIICADTLHLPPLVVQVILALSIVSTLIFLTKAADRWVLLLAIATLAVGFLRTLALLQIPESDISEFASGKRVYIAGTVVSDPRIEGDRVGLQVRCSRVKTYTGESPASGMVAVTLWQPLNGTILASPMYGDSLCIHGRLELPPAPTNPGEPAIGVRLSHRGIHCIISGPLAETVVVQPAKHSMMWVAKRSRAFLFQRSTSLFPAFYGRLLPGILLGDNSGIPMEVRDAFSRTGTSHLLVASGYNCAVVAAILGFILWRLSIPRIWRQLIVIVLIWCFTMCTAGGPSITRAATILTVFLLAYPLRRAADGINSLMLSAIVLLAFNPLQLFEPGFQLSFSVVLAVLLASPFLGDRSFTNPVHSGRDKVRSAEHFLVCSSRSIVGAVAFSFVVALAAFPIIASEFNRISLVSVVANALTCIVAFGVIGFGALSLVMSVVSRWLSACAAVPALFCMRLLYGTISSLSKLGFCVVSVRSPSTLLIIFYYILLFGALEYASRRSSETKKMDRSP